MQKFFKISIIFLFISSQLLTAEILSINELNKETIKKLDKLFRYQINYENFDKIFSSYKKSKELIKNEFETTKEFKQRKEFEQRKENVKKEFSNKYNKLFMSKFNYIYNKYNADKEEVTIKFTNNNYFEDKTYYKSSYDDENFDRIDKITRFYVEKKEDLELLKKYDILKFHMSIEDAKKYKPFLYVKLIYKVLDVDNNYESKNYLYKTKSYKDLTISKSLKIEPVAIIVHRGYKKIIKLITFKSFNRFQKDLNYL